MVALVGGGEGDSGGLRGVIQPHRISNLLIPKPEPAGRGPLAAWASRPVGGDDGKKRHARHIP
jgi:hypothetical protein